MSPIMPRLKAETRAAHQATEDTLLARAMASGTLTRSEYAAQLCAYLTVLTSLEERLAVSPRTAYVAGSPKKAARLRSDLAALHVIAGDALDAGDEDNPPTPRESGTRFSIAPRARLEATTALKAQIEEASESELLGILYVFEGSAIGASILYPRLRSTLGVSDDALSYYRGDGPATFELWKSFGARMNEILVHESEQDLAVSAARQTFDSIRAVFDALWDGARSSLAACG